MAYCTNCGAPMEGLYCTQCGARSAESGEPASGAPLAPGSPPSGASSPASQRKSKTLMYVLLGCGGVLVVALAAAIALGLFVRQKAGDVGRNPAMAAAKMVAALNPDIEVVSADEATGRITLREKKTGKTITMDFRDVQKGRIRFEGDGGERVEIESEGEGKSGTFRMKTPEGELRAGAGSLASLPSWVPVCPGAAPGEAFSAQSVEERTGTVHLKCRGAVEEVAAFYERELKAAGMKVQRQAVLSGEANMVILGGQGRSGEEVNVTVMSTDEGTAAHLVYKLRQ